MLAPLMLRPRLLYPRALIKKNRLRVGKEIFLKTKADGLN
jgi:hypothetical protein